MPAPFVTKEYCEDLGEQRQSGSADDVYRYWVYRFDIDGRHYRARIYTDRPHEADVMTADGTRHRERKDDLRVIGEYLLSDAGVRAISTLGASGAFERTLELG